MWEAFDPEEDQATGLFFHCRACGDARSVSVTRRHCLCGRTSAREIHGEVLLAGPGRVNRSPVLQRDRDEAPVRRPSVWTVH